MGELYQQVFEQVLRNPFAETSQLPSFSKSKGLNKLDKIDKFDDSDLVKGTKQLKEIIQHQEQWWDHWHQLVSSAKILLPERYTDLCALIKSFMAEWCTEEDLAYSYQRPYDHHFFLKVEQSAISSLLADLDKLRKENDSLNNLNDQDEMKSLTKKIKMFSPVKLMELFTKDEQLRTQHSSLWHSILLDAFESGYQSLAKDDNPKPVRISVTSDKDLAQCALCKIIEHEPAELLNTLFDKFAGDLKSAAAIEKIFTTMTRAGYLIKYALRNQDARVMTHLKNYLPNRTKGTETNGIKDSDAQRLNLHCILNKKLSFEAMFYLLDNQVLSLSQAKPFFHRLLNPRNKDEMTISSKFLLKMFRSFGNFYTSESDNSNSDVDNIVVRAPTTPLWKRIRRFHLADEDFVTAVDNAKRAEDTKVAAKAVEVANAAKVNLQKVKSEMRYEADDELELSYTPLKWKASDYVSDNETKETKGDNQDNQVIGIGYYNQVISKIFARWHADNDERNEERKKSSVKRKYTKADSTEMDKILADVKSNNGGRGFDNKSLKSYDPQILANLRTHVQLSRCRLPEVRQFYLLDPALGKKLGRGQGYSQDAWEIIVIDALEYESLDFLLDVEKQSRQLDESANSAKMQSFTFFNFDDDQVDDDEDDDPIDGDDDKYKTEQTLNSVRKNSDLRVFQHLLTLAPELVKTFSDVHYNNHHGQEGSIFLQESMGYLSPQIFAYLLQHEKISSKSLNLFFHTMHSFHEPSLATTNKNRYQMGKDLNADSKFYLQEEIYFFKLFLLLGNFIPNSETTRNTAEKDKINCSEANGVGRFDKLREIYTHYLNFVATTTSVLPTTALGSLMIQYFV